MKTNKSGHSIPSPLQCAIYRRIMRCLYDNFIESRLTFADFMETASYAAFTSHSPADTGNTAYSIECCTVEPIDGTVMIVTGQESLPIDAQTSFECDVTQTKRAWCILRQENAAKSVDYVLCDALEGSLSFLGATAQVACLQELTKNRQKQNVVRLLTDDIYLSDFTQTLGCYVSTLFPERKALPDTWVPVIDVFKYSDEEYERIANALRLAASLDLIYGDGEDEPIRFRIPLFHVVLASAFLLNGKSPLLKREHSAESVIAHRAIDWLEDILPLLSDAQVEFMAEYLLMEPETYGMQLRYLALNLPIPEELLCRICGEVFCGARAFDWAGELLAKQPQKKAVCRVITQYFREKVLAGAPKLCIAAAVVQTERCREKLLNPYAAASNLVLSQDAAEQLLGAYILKLYAWERYNQRSRLYCSCCHTALPDQEAVCKALIPKLSYVNEPFCALYVDVVFEMVLAGYMEQETLVKEEVFLSALYMLDSEEFKVCGWKLLSLFPISVQTISWGEKHASMQLRLLALQRYQETANDLARASLRFSSCAILGRWTQEEIYNQHVKLCIAHYRSKTPWDSTEMAMLCLIIKAILALPEIRARQEVRSTQHALPKMYEYMPIEAERCKALYGRAVRLSSSPMSLNTIQSETELLEQIHFVRMVQDCFALPKYMTYRTEVAVQLLLKCQTSFSIQSSYAITSVFGFHCVYGTPESALAFYREHRDALNRKDRSYGGTHSVPMWWESRVGVAGYIESLLCLPRVGTGIIRASRANRSEIALALLREASRVLDTPWDITRLSYSVKSNLADDLRELFPAQREYIRPSLEVEKFWDTFSLKELSIERDSFGREKRLGAWEAERKCGEQIFSAQNAPLFYDDPGFLSTVILRDPSAARVVLSLGYADDPVMVRRAVICCGEALDCASLRLQKDAELQTLARENTPAKCKPTDGNDRLNVFTENAEDEVEGTESMYF